LLIVTLAFAVAVPPLPSLTVSLAVNVPRLVYACVGPAPFTVGVPSPKSHVYVSASPSGSLEPALVNVTAWLRTDVYGPPALAVGGWLLIVTLALAVPV